MRIRLGAVRAAGTALQCRAVGHALLIHPKGEPDPQAAAFAAGLAPDPQHTVAVVDLPFGTLEDSADAVARLLAHRGHSLRLVFGRATPQESQRTAQRIADRLDRLVLAPDGEVLPTDGGGLFVPSEHGAGWLRFRPGRAAERDSRRFPKPRWEFSTFDRPWATSGHGLVEPVPSGVWVRSPHLPDSPESGQRLVDRLPSHPEILTVVLGSPGGPPVTLSDVARLWDTVLPSARSWVRFLHLGPVALPEGAEALGQELADALGQQVVLYTGVPVKARVGLDSPEVASLRPDGTLGHRPFVSELMYFPRTGDTPAPPALFGLRRPLVEVPEISTGVYEYAHDAVLEVVQSGLWMRPSVEPAGSDAVRRIPAAPGYAAILYDRSTPGAEERMRALAEDMLWKLDPDRREGFTVVPADEPGVAAGVPDDAYLWSPQDPAAYGPQMVAPPLTRQRRPAEIAPWAPASTGRPQEGRERAAVPAGVPGRASALNPLDPDESPAVRVAGRNDTASAVAPAPAPQAARTESDVPSAALPRTESDAGRSAADEAEASGEATRVATAATEGSIAPGLRPDAPHGGPNPAPEPPPTGEPLPLPPPTPDAARGPVPPAPAPAPAPNGQVTPSRPKLPDLPTVSEPAPAGEPQAPVEPPRTDPRPAAAPDRADTAPSGEQRTPALPPEPPANTPEAAPNAPDTEQGAPQAPDAPGTLPQQTPQAPPSAPDGPEAAVPQAPEAPQTPPSAPQASEAPVPVAPKPAAKAVPAPARMIRLESDAPAAAPTQPADPGPTPVPDGSDGPVTPSLAPAASDGPGSAVTPATPAAGAGVRVQPVPKGSACAVLPERGTSKERGWVRRTFSTQYNAVAGTVSRVMSESPGLRGGGRGEAADALTDLVAVRLYLSGDSRQVDDAVRSAQVGPHVPLARCVAAGLRRLPSYRGAALLRAPATAMERAWYREGRLTTEWAFCTAYSAPHPGPENGTDFLIWSMTARRTSLIDPSEPYRVVFLPGTTFKVLRPSDGEGPVLMRELSPSEIASDGKVDVQRVPLDEIALDGLERAAGALSANDASGSAAAGGGDQGGTRPEERFGTPPGLIGAAQPRRPRGNGGDMSASDKGAKL
ncbi:hypothetical protein [Streptomyces gibsoniae]|uniref:ADP ribosyltransferase domain-containing protein n=1 Tax=Streptomyces gibsoniae TaxID=3075529 RepID=A0ABU2TUD4_9ACTN|nr:hypothetical protein [Streptomyces sp. DSM 41699]MDT0464431.1 hypothetical protein [Streptomyces sp. DSM 41699]